MQRKWPFLALIVLSYFTLAVDLLNVHRSFTPVFRAQKPTWVSVFYFILASRKECLKYITRKKNFGRLQFRAKQVFENKIVEDFKRRNILQYSINFLSSSKTLSFHEATSSCRWNTVSSIWYIFSIESKTYCDYCKRKSKIVKMYANIHANVKMYAN